MASTSGLAGTSSMPTSRRNTPATSRILETGPQPANGAVVHRRIFIGPMPEKVIAHRESQEKKTKTKITISSVLSLDFYTHAGESNAKGNADKSDDVSYMIKENALRFFLHHGGNIDDWDDEEEQNTLEELRNRWKQSEWAQLWHNRHHRGKHSHRENDQHKVDTNWFGKSFEVGSLLGLNVLESSGHFTNRSIPVSSKGEHSSLASTESLAVNETSTYPATTGTATYITANSELLGGIPPLPNEELGISKSSLPGNNSVSSPASSHTGLLRKQRTAEESVSQSSVKGSKPLLKGSQGKGKARVRYSDVSPAPEQPAPVEEVLGRTKDTVDPNTSQAAAASKGVEDEDFKWGDVILRDRMLVRVSYTKAEVITEFNDVVNRTTRDLHFEDWGEFLVVWRRDSIEIYRDHNTPGKEWITGRKHLSYVIPFKSSRTRLSLYSFVDLTFCITCPPTTSKLNASASRWIFSSEKEGTQIFIFKVKSRSRAYDWSWQLWRQMGGQIPKMVDIHNPRLNTKITIDVPEYVDTDSATLYNLFKREHVINMCMELLPSVPDWQFLVDAEIKKGKTLQLAWRVDANLDWVWLDDDVEGKPRDWAVLCGLAFKQASRPPLLEIRLANHAPNHIHLKDGKQLEEPPSLEGYLDRIRPNTQTRNQIYISTHNGNLFILNPTHAFPPMPPGLTPLSNVYEDSQNLRYAEVRRGSNQIMMATGVCDLRTIIAVRRASHPTSAHMHNEREVNEQNPSWMATWKTAEGRSREDEADEGGEVGLSKHSDRTGMRVKRSFELLLNTGHVVRFEAFSCGVAIEWVERLRALVFYWKIRHRLDAKQEIELAHVQRPRLTPQTRVCADEHDVPPQTPGDLSAPYQAIDTLFNWCVLEGCKPSVRGGRLYMKKGLHGQYKLVQLFLVAGHLIRFRIGSQSSVYPAVGKKVNLIDAYTCSGYFAAQTLPKGQYRPNADPSPRRYQDGLETSDPEEDMLFMIWYRPQPAITEAEFDPTIHLSQSKAVPALSAKHKTLVFKTRSLFERDSWCWALNAEIEKISRTQKVREKRIRETGDLVPLNFR